MAEVWGDAHRFELWLKIELLACEAWAREGRVPPEALKKIQARAKIQPKRIEEIEREVRHDLIAFVTAVGETVGEESRYIHLGLTSSDVLDTALGFQLAQAADLLAGGVKESLEVLAKLSRKYEKTPMMGRTHGIHAEPITFGLKAATWYAEIRRQLERLNAARTTIAVGKISGAVGTYVHVPPQVEEFVLSRLGLKPETAPTQIVSRDRHAFYFSTLAGIATTIEKIATEIRHLARTEIGEVAEPFGSLQKGSSAMPHKRNPILCENLTGLARLMRSYAQAALENVALWHERDISHSSVERVIAPDATILLDFMIARLHEVLSGLEVFPERMKQNLMATRGVVFSQEVLLALVQAGMSREKAYKIVQGHAFKALQNGDDFSERVGKDAEVGKYLKDKDLKVLFDWNKKLAAVSDIIRRTLK